MTIEVLLAGNDERYIKRLAEAMKTRKLKTGDSLVLSFFTDKDKLLAALYDRKAAGRKARYHMALMDEDLDVPELELSGLPLVFVLTEESDLDGSACTLQNEQSAAYIYKYQRISGIVDRITVESAKKRTLGRKGTANVYAFFSPAGGCGTSTVAAAYAVALAKAGIKPLYASFEPFNSTEAFFSDQTGNSGGLYDVFCVIAAGGGAVATVDAIKTIDSSGVSFLKRFPMWVDVAQITPDHIESFIDAARGSNDTSVVILDMGNAYTQFTERALEYADKVYVVSDTHSTSLLKLGILFGDKTFFDPDIKDKAALIFNKTSGHGPSEDFGVKSVTAVSRAQANSMPELLTKLAGELGGLVRRG